MQLEHRSILKMILLSIVTCGIYGIIWYIKLAKDAVHVKDADDDGTLELILMLLFFPVGIYLSEKKFSEGCALHGIPHNDNTILYIVLSVFGLGLVDVCLLQNDLNKLADAGFVCTGSSNGYYYQQNYQQPQYQQPQYQQPQYQQPQYQQPQYQQPQYQQPQYQQPTYQAPDEAPVEQPTYQAPETTENSDNDPQI